MQQLKLVLVVLHAIFREDKWHDAKWELYFAKTTLWQHRHRSHKSQKKLPVSFKTIKDVLLIILSKNNGILRITEAKFDGEKRKNLQYTAKFAKWPRWVNLSVLNIGRFACSVMQNTTVMFKQMRNLTREKKFSEKIKIILFANVVT